MATQETLVSDIQKAHTEFSQSGNSESEREVLLKKLASSYDAFMQLNDNLQEGTKFYNDLTQLLVTFQGKINDYCFARRTEKEELMKDLTQGLANPSIGSTPTAPAHHQEAAKTLPARPPPPQVNPYAGAPSQLSSAPPSAGAPPAAGAPPMAGAPPAVAPQQPGALPYPVNPPQGMPTPQGYVYNQYPVYTPMPMGYNPYFQQQPGGYGSYAAPPYPQQAPSHPAYPYPQQQPPQQWPPRT